MTNIVKLTEEKKSEKVQFDAFGRPIGTDDAEITVDNIKEKEKLRQKLEGQAKNNSYVPEGDVAEVLGQFQEQKKESGRFMGCVEYLDNNFYGMLAGYGGAYALWKLAISPNSPIDLLFFGSIRNRMKDRAETLRLKKAGRLPDAQGNVKKSELINDAFDNMKQASADLRSTEFEEARRSVQGREYANKTFAEPSGWQKFKDGMAKNIQDFGRGKVRLGGWIGLISGAYYYYNKLAAAAQNAPGDTEAEKRKNLGRITVEQVGNIAFTMKAVDNVLFFNYLSEAMGYKQKDGANAKLCSMATIISVAAMTIVTKKAFAKMTSSKAPSGSGAMRREFVNQFRITGKGFYDRFEKAFRSAFKKFYEKNAKTIKQYDDRIRTNLQTIFPNNKWATEGGGGDVVSDVLKDLDTQIIDAGGPRKFFLKSFDDAAAEAGEEFSARMKDSPFDELMKDTFGRRRMALNAAKEGADGALTKQIDAALAELDEAEQFVLDYAANALKATDDGMNIVRRQIIRENKRALRGWFTTVKSVEDDGFQRLREAFESTTRRVDEWNERPFFEAPDPDALARELEDFGMTVRTLDIDFIFQGGQGGDIFEGLQRYKEFETNFKNLIDDAEIPKALNLDSPAKLAVGTPSRGAKKNSEEVMDEIIRILGMPGSTGQEKALVKAIKRVLQKSIDDIDATAADDVLDSGGSTVLSRNLDDIGKAEKTITTKLTPEQAEQEFIDILKNLIYRKYRNTDEFSMSQQAANMKEAEFFDVARRKYRQVIKDVESDPEFRGLLDVDQPLSGKKRVKRTRQLGDWLTNNPRSRDKLLEMGIPPNKLNTFILNGVRTSVGFTLAYHIADTAEDLAYNSMQLRGEGAPIVYTTDTYLSRILNSTAGLSHYAQFYDYITKKAIEKGVDPTEYGHKFIKTVGDSFMEIIKESPDQEGTVANEVRKKIKDFIGRSRSDNERKTSSDRAMEILEYIEENAGPENAKGFQISKLINDNLSSVGAPAKGSESAKREKVAQEKIRASYRTLNRFILMNSNIFVRLVKALNATAVPDNLDDIFYLDSDDLKTVWAALTRLYHYAYPDELDGKIYENDEWSFPFWRQIKSLVSDDKRAYDQGRSERANESTILRKIIYQKEDLSKLVREVINEFSYGKGYTPYPYHSDIGRDDEPAEDFIQDWKGFELSLVRDESRKTAIQLAKVLVKDLELFGDVVDLIGQNQSVATEILKSIRKNEEKS